MLAVTERAKVTLAQPKMQSKIEDVDVGLVFAGGPARRLGITSPNTAGPRSCSWRKS